MTCCHCGLDLTAAQAAKFRYSLKSGPCAGPFCSRDCGFAVRYKDTDRNLRRRRHAAA